MALRWRSDPGTPGERLLSRRTWFDQMAYNALVERISVRTTHVERGERALENKAHEEAKRTARKEAAAQARREAVDTRRTELEEARITALKKRTHKKRAAKKAAKRAQQGRQDREPKISTSPEDAASEELLRHIEEELTELGEEFVPDETYYSSDEECEMSSNQGAMKTAVDVKTRKESSKDKSSVIFRDSIKESVQTASNAKMEAIKEKTQQASIQKLKEKARKAEEFYLKIDAQVADALLKNTKLEHGFLKAETTAKRTADAAMKAAENASMLREEVREAAKLLASLRVVALSAEKNHAETQKALETAEEVLYEEHTQETAVIVKANPLLDFLTETVQSKSGELECPVCFEEASSPIYSCRRGGHIICSSCRPQLSDCPECRQSLGREWLRHRFAEKTAEELKKLRDRRESLL